MTKMMMMNKANNTLIVIHTCTFLRLNFSFVLGRVWTQIAAHLCARSSSMSCKKSFSSEFRDFDFQFYPPPRCMCWLCRRVIISRWNVCDKKCIMARTFVFSSFSFCFWCICTSSPIIIALFVPCTLSLTLRAASIFYFLRREWQTSNREEKKCWQLRKSKRMSILGKEACAIHCGHSIGLFDFVVRR